jgi:DNA (cytosine-5)-methyltransferase 1
MKVLDLFSGIGGFSLGLERAGMETIAFCEIEPFCREVLKKHWPSVPIYKDIRELKGGKIEADVICGGYPCQPFSVAGNRRGEEDDRHLWPEMLRIIKEVRPSWVICENVYGHVSMGLDEVLSDLATEGYATKVFTIPACGLDAPHRRNRVWIVANSTSRKNNRRERRDVVKTKKKMGRYQHPL